MTEAPKTFADAAVITAQTLDREEVIKEELSQDLLFSRKPGKALRLTTGRVYIDEGKDEKDFPLPKTLEELQVIPELTTWGMLYLSVIRLLPTESGRSAKQVRRINKEVRKGTRTVSVYNSLGKVA